MHTIHRIYTCCIYLYILNIYRFILNLNNVYAVNRYHRTNLNCLGTILASLEQFMEKYWKCVVVMPNLNWIKVEISLVDIYHLGNPVVDKILFGCNRFYSTMQLSKSNIYFEYYPFHLLSTFQLFIISSNQSKSTC